MNSFLLNRQLGSISPQAVAQAQNLRLLQSLSSAPDVSFAQRVAEKEVSVGNVHDVAHAAGVNSIAIDRFEGRYLLSGGADSSVAIWDLETATYDDKGRALHTPLTHTARTSTTASLGITEISFYPFDSLAFLTSSYDRTLKLFSSETLVASATFDLESTVYVHSTSTVASHLLVACGSQHPAVRLVDLKSGAMTHSLAGHAGSVLAVAWHPKDEFVLASGATDGVCRLWDIRRSASSLGVLDMEDHIGIAGYDEKGTGARRRERGKSHSGTVNGITWTGDGRYLITTGHDEHMRVWDMVNGANTLANFGPALRNTQTAPLRPLVAPAHLSGTSNSMIFYPNSQEILGFNLHSGTLLARLRDTTEPSGAGARNSVKRTTSLAWRAHHVEMYSAHANGTIRCWRPRTSEDIEADVETAEDETTAIDLTERKRKREDLNQIVRDLTKKR